MLKSALAFDPEKQFGTENRITGQDYVLALFVASVVAIANILYVFDLFLLWHDDNQSYYSASLGNMLIRGGGAITRHIVIDNILLHTMANVSPFAARVLAIFIGAVPLAVMLFFILRSGFGIDRAGAAFGASFPLIVSGQYEVFVGLNLTYVAFDAVMACAALLLIIWMYQTRSWGALISGSIGVAIILSDGIVSSLLVAPALVVFAALAKDVPLWSRALPISAVLLATTKSTLELSRQGLTQISETPFAAFLGNLHKPLDFVLPGGQMMAWAALLVFALLSLYALIVAWRARSSALLLGFGVAAALYLVPVFVYSLGRPGFPNRYAFLPVIGIAIALAVIIHLVARWLDSKSGKFEPVLSLRMGGSITPATLTVIVAILGLGYQKSQHVDPMFSLISNTTRVVADYFNGRRDPISVVGAPTSGVQLIVLAESGFPYMYPHRYPALGYLRFVTGDDRAVGFAGSRKLCATPFEPWGGPWQFGPGGFAEDLPGRIVAFRGENGTGAELSHVLSTEANALDTADGPQAWTLYRFDQSGAESLTAGAGQAELEAALAERDLQPHQLAFSCGL